MIYIPGTKFINNEKRYAKFFKIGIPYVLIHIEKDNDQVKYVFKEVYDKKSESSEVKFNTIEEADQFLRTISIK